MRVYLTFDIEIWCDGWSDLDRKFPKAFERYVYGRSRHGDYALPKTLDILGRHGLSGVFFVEPLFSTRFGREHLATIVSLIQARGQSVQLHLHPEWCDEVQPPLIAGLNAKQPNLSGLTPGQQASLIQQGLALLAEAGAQPIHAFRAGSYAANADTLAALAHAGLVADSSYNLCYDTTPRDSLGASDGMLRSTEQVTEFPITVFRDGFGRLRPAQVGACSLGEMIGAMASAQQQGVSDFVIVSHNFEMLRPGTAEPDWVVVRRFDGLCAHLAAHPDRYQVQAGYLQACHARDVSIASAPPTAMPQSTLVRHAEQAWRRLVR